jgi:hypothetical protein
MALAATMPRIGWFALLASLLPGVALAQTVTLEGRVTDPLGGTINAAVVTLSGPGTTTARTTRTGVDGTFSVEAVPVGSASLSVEAPGFESSQQTVSVTAAMAPLSVVLKIAGVVESVGVVAPRLEEELPQIIERSGVRAQTITAAQIENGGYYDVAQALQALVPGLFLTPKAGPFDYVTASLQGSQNQRNSLARRWCPHQQSPVQRHHAARHHPGAHGGTDRSPGRGAGALLRNAGRRGRDQRGDEVLYGRQERLAPGRRQY